MAHSEGNIGASGDSDVIECTDEHVVWGARLSLSDLGGGGEGFVWVLQDKASDHGCVTGVSVGKVEAGHNLVDKCGLGE